MDRSLTLLDARLVSGARVDLDVDAGRITAIAPADGARSGTALDDWTTSSDTVDLAGALLLPALVNGHAHLDKTFVGADWQPYRGGSSVPERVLEERAIRGTLDASVYERAAALADAMVRYGTGAVRTHVDIDTAIGLGSLEPVLELREALRDVLTVQVVAFPQSGILASPGVEDLLVEAVRQGADVVGGLDPTGYDGDADAHLDIVFGVAERFGVAVDIHLHDLGAVAVRQYEQIARRTSDKGLAGKVVISHAYGLGSIPVEEAKRLGALFAQHGVAVMTNGPAGPMPPVLAMRAEGATVFSGSDNIRDAWWPYGSGDMLDIARQVAYQSNFRVDDELEVALDMVTGSAARGIGLADYGLEVGARADLLIVDSPVPAAAVAAPPQRRAVVHGGRLVSTARTVRTAHPTPPRRPLPQLTAAHVD